MAEGIGFRDRIREFEARGVQILGISTDTMEANAAFAQRHKIPFPLLCDTKRTICMAYGACDSPDAARARRMTFVIGPDGKIQQVLEGFNPTEHAEALLASLNQATSSPSIRQSISSVDDITPQSSCEDITEKEGVEMSDEQKEAANTQSQKSADVEPVEATHPLSASEVQSREIVASGSKAPATSSITPTATAMRSLESTMPGQITPSGGGGNSVSLVYALGTLSYDFGVEARRDSIMQHMGTGANPHDPKQLLDYLGNNPWDCGSILWTLNLDGPIPIYAIRPQGAFAEAIYHRLCQFLREQLTEGVERICVPGIITGQARLLSGQVVPVIRPEPRCMYNWTTNALVEAISGKAPAQSAKANEQEAYTQKTETVGNFLERVYHELRNLGITPQERAINYAATNALNVEKIFEAALREEMQLDTMGVEESPIGRPGSECYDVILTFFNPRKQLEQARKVYRFTCDVSDVCPVMVGTVRSWYVR